MNLKSKNNTSVGAFTLVNDNTATTPSTSVNWYNISSFNDLATGLELLENEVKENTRQISYWDVYRFSDSVEDADDFAKKWVELANNHALVINTNFSGYSVGDVVIKTDDGNKIVVRGRQNGIFVPSSYENGVLTYQYMDAAPENPPQITIGSSQTALSCYSIQHPHPADESEYSFNAIEGIAPVIKFYIGSDDKEEVSVSYKMESSGNKYKLTNLPQLDCTIVVK